MDIVEMLLETCDVTILRCDMSDESDLFGHYLFYRNKYYRRTFAAMQCLLHYDTYNHLVLHNLDSLAMLWAVLCFTQWNNSA